MKMQALLIVAASLLVPMAAIGGDSPLHGIWRINVESFQASQPGKFVIRDGTYTCLSCRPSYSIPADGDFHPVSDRPDLDELAVRVIDANQVQITQRKDGQVVANTTRTLTENGATTMVAHEDHSGSAPVTSIFHDTRAGTLPEAAHATSGAWHLANYETISDTGRTFTYAVAGNRLKMSNPRGHMFVAPMDGTEVAYSGSPLITSVSVEKMANHRVRILSRHEGTVVGITTVHVMPTGNMMKVVEESPLNGNSISFTADRQDSIVHDPGFAAGGGDISDSCRLGNCGARR